MAELKSDKPLGFQEALDIYVKIYNGLLRKHGNRWEELSKMGVHSPETIARARNEFEETAVKGMRDATKSRLQRTADEEVRDALKALVYAYDAIVCERQAPKREVETGRLAAEIMKEAIENKLPEKAPVKKGKVPVVHAKP